MRRALAVVLLLLAAHAAAQVLDTPSQRAAKEFALRMQAEYTPCGVPLYERVLGCATHAWLTPTLIQRFIDMEIAWEPLSEWSLREHGEVTRHYGTPYGDVMMMMFQEKVGVSTVTWVLFYDTAAILAECHIEHKAGCP